MQQLTTYRRPDPRFRAASIRLPASSRTCLLLLMKDRPDESSLRTHLAQSNPLGVRYSSSTLPHEEHWVLGVVIVVTTWFCRARLYSFAGTLRLIIASGMAALLASISRCR